MKLSKNIFLNNIDSINLGLFEFNLVFWMFIFLCIIAYYLINWGIPVLSYYMAYPKPF